MNCKYYYIGRVPIAITNIDKTAALIYDTIVRSGKGYVCVSNMRTVTLANKDDKYDKVMKHSLLNVPDGTPLVWCARWWGIKKAECVRGQMLFRKMLADKEGRFRHFFLGDTDDTLAKVEKKAEETAGAQVCGSYSPPFAPLEEFDINGIAAMINSSGANVVWTSLRAPKQDYLASMLLPLLKGGIVVIGVGAAFRGYIGELSVADSGFLQRSGLSGLAMRREGRSIWTQLWWYVKHTFVLMGYFCSIKWKRYWGRKRKTQ